jgi:histone H3/H4
MLSDLSIFSWIIIMTNKLPLAAVIRLIRSADPSFRVSESAGKALREKLEEFGLRISTKAKEFTTHANRKTITDSDINLAGKNL